MENTKNISLLIALDNAIIYASNKQQIAELERMRIKEKERILKEEQNWDSEKHIYLTGNGYYKTKKPKQICRKNKDDIINIVYDFYYGNFSFTIENCFESAIKEFEKDVLLEQRESTSLRIYKSNYKRFFGNYPISKMQITKIKAKDIKNHFKQIIYDLQLSRRGLNDAKTVLNRIFDYAIDEGIITENLARNISTINIVCYDKDKNELVYTDEEREKLLKIMEKDFDHIASRALMLMFCLCIRSGELRGLKWEDIDWNNKTIYIHGQVSRKIINGKNIYVYQNQTKNKDATGKRYQRLSNRAIEILKKHRKVYRYVFKLY